MYIYIYICRETERDTYTHIYIYTLGSRGHIFPHWLGQAGIVHIGLDQRVLTVVCEIRERNSLGSRGPGGEAADGREAVEAILY